MPISTKKLIARTFPAVFGCSLLAIPVVTGAQSAESTVDTPLPAYARSVSGKSMPSFEATWSLFIFVSALEEREAGTGRAHLKNTVGLREEGAASLSRYIEKVVGAHQALSDELKQRMCSDRDQFTSRRGLASALRQVDQQLDRAREADVARLFEVLEAGDMSELNQWVETNLRPKLSGIVFDHSKYFETRQVTPRQALKQLCDPSSG